MCLECDRLVEDTKRILADQKLDNVCQCGGTLKQNDECDLVCKECGQVHSRNQLKSHWVDNLPSQRGYKPIFYCNERISQLTGHEPPTPPILLQYIWVCWIINDKPALDQAQIYKLCKSVSLHDTNTPLNRVHLPLYLAQRYNIRRSGEPLANLKEKYAEKWRSIITSLSGESPPLLEQGLVIFIKRMFTMFESDFQKRRHGTDCTGTKDCHKRASCHHNLIAYDFQFDECMAMYYGRKSKSRRRWKAWLRRLSRNTKSSYRKRFWNPFIKSLKQRGEFKHWNEKLRV